MADVAGGAGSLGLAPGQHCQHVVGPHVQVHQVLRQRLHCTDMAGSTADNHNLRCAVCNAQVWLMIQPQSPPYNLRCLVCIAQKWPAQPRSPTSRSACATLGSQAQEQPSLVESSRHARTEDAVLQHSHNPVLRMCRLATCPSLPSSQRMLSSPGLCSASRTVSDTRAKPPSTCTPSMPRPRSQRSWLAMPAGGHALNVEEVPDDSCSRCQSRTWNRMAPAAMRDQVS